MLPHLLLTEPFLWDSVATVEVNGQVVHSLLVVPISEHESRYAEVEGTAALEQVFESHQIDVFNWTRHSVI